MVRAGVGGESVFASVLCVLCSVWADIAQDNADMLTRADIAQDKKVKERT